MICPHCQKKLIDEANFCDRCGMKIPKCPQCGQVLTKRVQFCSYDGAPIPEAVQVLLPPDKPSRPAAPPKAAPRRTAARKAVVPPERWKQLELQYGIAKKEAWAGVQAQILEKYRFLLEKRREEIAAEEKKALEHNLQALETILQKKQMQEVEKACSEREAVLTARQKKIEEGFIEQWEIQSRRRFQQKYLDLEEELKSATDPDIVVKRREELEKFRQAELEERFLRLRKTSEELIAEKLDQEREEIEKRVRSGLAKRRDLCINEIRKRIAQETGDRFKWVQNDLDRQSRAELNQRYSELEAELDRRYHELEADLKAGKALEPQEIEARLKYMQVISSSAPTGNTAL